jgi:hypothetical protein
MPTQEKEEWPRLSEATPTPTTTDQSVREVNSTATAPHRDSELDFAGLLDRLCYTDDERVVITYGKARDVVRAGDAAAHNDTLPDTDRWFNVNPTSLPLQCGSSFRGTVAQVTRLAALYLDLDIKEGGCPDIETAEAIVDDLSRLLGTRPVAVVHSGHGLHAYWALDGARADVYGTAVLKALLRRWKLLVDRVARSRNAHADNVFDAARMLRIPGSTNYKEAEPAPVVGYADSGAPLTVDEAHERLDEADIADVNVEDFAGGDTIGGPEAAQNVRDALTAGDPSWNVAKRLSDALEALNAPDRFPTTRGHALMLLRLGHLGEPGANSAVTTLFDAYVPAVATDRVGGARAATAEFQRFVNGAGRLLAKPFTTGTSADDRVLFELARLPYPTTREEWEPYMSHRNTSPRTAVTTAEKPAADQPPQGRRIRLVAASSVHDDVPSWAWEYAEKGRIQLGTLALFAGRPGAGKSTAARWFAAGYSRGTISGCYCGQPQNVAYIVGEESKTYTVKPALRAAGADLDRVFFPEVTSDGKVARLHSAADEAELIEVLSAASIRIIIVDPVMSTIGASVEPWHRIRMTAGSRAEVNPITSLIFSTS